MSFHKKNKRNRLLRVTIALFVMVDLIVKRWIFAHSWDSQLIVPILNPGAARSLNIDISLLIAVTIIAVVGLIYLRYRKFISGRSFVLITAGALGNLYDRVIIGGVRDRIHISIFPVFNLADIMITIGVLLIAVHYRTQSRLERNQ